MTNASWIDFWASAAILLPAFMISVSFHECSHALAAYLLGDPTAKQSGRLTLNPLAHLDFLGMLFLILFRFGWANPVPMDQRNFKYPRIYSILTALAGPSSNFILAYASLMLIHHFPSNLVYPAITQTVIQLLTATAYINIMLGAFNILPIPPLDGSHILIALIAKPFPRLVLWIYRYSLFFLLLLFMLPPTRLALMQLISYVEHIIQSLVF